MQRFGDELRIERERRRVTLDTICALTKVSVRHLEALEAGNYTELPGGVFRKGIVRGYLSALGVEDPPLWLERFDADLRSSGALGTEEDWEEFAENVRRNRVGTGSARIDSRWIGVALMIGTLVFLGWGVWRLVLHGHLFL
ncbi:MAG TPA: helix-turn-helix domain-containing protein [Edaphobacter sp.]|jgi:cytoskeleton protein RodZ|nr:helix-turn-helix domain-containing protein [Edaphobacter sp.]